MLKKTPAETYRLITGTEPDTSSPLFKRFCLLLHYIKTGNSGRIDDGIKNKQWKRSTVVALKQLQTGR